MWYWVVHELWLKWKMMANVSQPFSGFLSASEHNFSLRQNIMGWMVCRPFKCNANRYDMKWPLHIMWCMRGDSCVRRCGHVSAQFGAKFTCRRWRRCDNLSLSRNNSRPKRHVANWQTARASGELRNFSVCATLSKLPLKWPCVSFTFYSSLPCIFRGDFLTVAVFLLHQSTRDRRSRMVGTERVERWRSYSRRRGRHRHHNISRY